MKYRVIITDDSLVDARNFLTYITGEKQMPETAEKWWTKALAAIDTLEFMPHRCSYAPENEMSKHTIRVLGVDNCLFLFRVVEENKTVRILRLRHGRQLPFDVD